MLYETNPQLEARLERLLARRKPWRVLEAGCGSASHLRFPEGTIVCGIDISPKQLERNHHLHEKIVGDLQTYRLPQNAYDLIVCWDVLEHLPEPEKALENFFNSVNEGGLVILASPNVATLRGLVTKFTPHWVHVLYARHIAGYEQAGQEESYPFVTYHRWAIAPRAIERLANARQMSVISSNTFGFEHPEQKHRALYAAWSLVDRAAWLASLGMLGTDKDAAFCIILQKDHRRHAVAPQASAPPSSGEESMKQRRDIGAPRAIEILGIPIHDLTMEETIQAMTQMALSGMPHHVMTVNPEFVMIAQRDTAFRTALMRASLCVADGIGIVWASRLLGTPLRARITGSDSIPRFARAAAEHGIRLFLLGAAPGVAEEAAALLVKNNPGLQIAGTYAGSPSPEEEDAICRMIEQARPHVLLVAYGPPRQDLWIARTQARLRLPLAIGVGGTFDFIAGRIRRAPAWMQNLGLEWLYRLMREPRRWRRMLTLPQFAAAIILERFFSHTPEYRWSARQQNQ